MPPDYLYLFTAFTITFLHAFHHLLNAFFGWLSETMLWISHIAVADPVAFLQVDKILAVVHLNLINPSVHDILAISYGVGKFLHLENNYNLCL